MGPGVFKNRLILLGVKVLVVGRQRAADVGLDHGHNVRHECLGEDLLPRLGIYVVHKLEQRRSLHLLPPLVTGKGAVHNKFQRASHCEE